MAALALALAAFAFVAVAVVVGRRELRALVHVYPSPLREPLLVIVPARNEEATIGFCLSRILKDPYGGLLVVVVDDRSTDKTAEVVARVAAADPRVHVHTIEQEPPAGMFGKPRALAVAVARARAAGGLPRMLAFVDADVTIEEGTLGGLCNALHGEHATAITGVPKLITESAAEQLLVPTLASIVTSPYLPSRVHSAGDKTAFLNGQIIVVDSDAYVAAGGFPTNTVLEDVALARALKERGGTLRVADLRKLASTRMYDSVAGVVEGFGKNAVALLGKRAGAVGCFAFITSLLPWLALALTAPSVVQLAQTVAGGASVVDAGAADPFALPALGIVLATFLGQAYARAITGAPVWPVLLLPFSYAGAAYVLVKASLRAASGKPMTWKGRSYPSTAPPPPPSPSPPSPVQ